MTASLGFRPQPSLASPVLSCLPLSCSIPPPLHSPCCPCGNSPVARPSAAPSTDCPGGKRQCCSGSEPGKSRDPHTPPWVTVHPAPRGSGYGEASQGQGQHWGKGGRGEKDKKVKEYKGWRGRPPVEALPLPWLIRLITSLLNPRHPWSACLCPFARGTPSPLLSDPLRSTCSAICCFCLASSSTPLIMWGTHSLWSHGVNTGVRADQSAPPSGYCDWIRNRQMTQTSQSRYFLGLLCQSHGRKIVFLL